MKILFLDESGDHNLELVDPQYPVFVLGGIIVDKDYAEGPLDDAVRKLKLKFFGDPDIVLHTADIARNKNGFEPLKDTVFRARFRDAINQMMQDLEYSVISCVIEKNKHYSRYGIAALDPYLLSLNILVEQFCFDISNQDEPGLIVAEKRDPILDRELELAWLNLKIKGTKHVRASKIDSKISGLTLLSKKSNNAGLQLADLVVSPIGRYILGKQNKPDWKIIKSKMKKGADGNIQGFGLVVLPKK